MQISVWIPTSLTLTKSCLNKSYMFIYDHLATIHHFISKEPPQVLHVSQAVHPPLQVLTVENSAAHISGAFQQYLIH